MRSLCHKTLNMSVLEVANGLHRRPLPLAGNSKHETSQSPDPVASKFTSTEESVEKPSCGEEMIA
jgi:hypothetical protein